MKPSQVSAELKKIASSIENCSTKVRPDLVTRDLRQVLAAVGGGTEFHMVITDAPVGVAVGFVPSQEALDTIGGGIDSQWELVDDDGSDDADPILVGPKNEVILRSESQQPLTDDEREAGILPLGMDMLVWRDEASMLEDLTG